MNAIFRILSYFWWRQGPFRCSRKWLAPKRYGLQMMQHPHSTAPILIPTPCIEQAAIMEMIPMVNVEYHQQSASQCRQAATLCFGTAWRWEWSITLSSLRNTISHSLHECIRGSRTISNRWIGSVHRGSLFICTGMLHRHHHHHHHHCYHRNRPPSPLPSPSAHL